ncbi:uncharacterized protein LOC116621145 [Nematostella vectensis]|uniref:uncharacterized protein LOC116621145 n=1 Tax=Nematostella vectensis TaxID=45351 RepID=UPI0020779410|nr:uncharacterized protein LOC116621145 [Nematostella vectensis]
MSRQDGLLPKICKQYCKPGYPNCSEGYVRQPCDTWKGCYWCQVPKSRNNGKRGQCGPRLTFARGFGSEDLAHSSSWDGAICTLALSRGTGMAVAQHQDSHGQNP